MSESVKMKEEEFCENCGEVIARNQPIVYEKHDGAYHKEHAPKNWDSSSQFVLVSAEEREKWNLP